MGLMRRVNKLDERTGAAKVGRGLYLTMGVWTKVWVLLVLGAGLYGEYKGAEVIWAALAAFASVGILLAVLFDPWVGRRYDATMARRRRNRASG